MKIYCCGCSQDINARLTSGGEVYPHRRDLATLPFWKCDTCGNHVGCHYKTSNPTQPLGVISTPEIRAARRHIHRLFDEILAEGTITKAELYMAISERIGDHYHTGNIKSVSDARNIYRIARVIKFKLESEGP